MKRLLAHMWGDYVLQSDWMALNKTIKNGPAAAHAITYAACFLPLTRNWKPLAVIGGTHFVIDRWRLAKHLTWAKNQIGPVDIRPGHTATGYPDTKPIWMSTWLLIIADNAVHMLINEWALDRWK
jgi:Protein of unknown function (DUF3307)